MVTLLSDFGGRDGFVGIMKGVVLSCCPDARLVDLTHEIDPQDVLAGALVLESAVDHFPPGTVHLAVVDPGVGSERKALLVETAAFALVGPDNGLLSLAARRSPVREIRSLDRPEWHRAEVSGTFHGRDVFAPVAGARASGVAPERLGSAVDDLVGLDLPGVKREGDTVTGEVIHVDRFGNLITNVRPADLAGFRPDSVSTSIGRMRIDGLARHYAAAPDGGLLLVANSQERLEIAVRNGSAARRLGAGRGTPVRVTGDAA